MKLLNLNLIFVCVTQIFFVNAETFGILNQRLNNPIHYNLTELIDTALQSNDSSDHTTLKDALENSRFVFYETDVALNNFSNLIPLMRLMSALKPSGAPPQIILSFRYVNRSSWKLLQTRANDVFYNVMPKLGFIDQENFVKHIGAVVLDFYTPNDPQSQSDFLHGKSYFEDHSFTYSVKSFLMQLLQRNVSVGIIIGKDFHGYFMKRQSQHADFFVHCIQHTFHSQFSMFAEDFNVVINNKLSSIQNQANRYFGNTKTFDMIIFKVLNDHNPNNLLAGNYDYRSSGNYWRSFGMVIEGTSNYSSISKNLLQKSYKNAQESLNEIILKWASVQTGNFVIISVPPKRGSGGPKTNLIHPFLRLAEEDMNVCNLRANLSAVQHRFGSLVTTEKTWKGMTRYNHALMDDTIYCHGNDALKIKEDLRQNVTLNFTAGVSSVWQEIQPFIVDLVYNHSNVGNFRLETLLFTEEDIKTSVAIQNFATNAKKNDFRLGCIVSFYSLRTQFGEFYHGKEVTHESFKATLKATLCQPLFDSIDTFVWKVDDKSDEYFRTQGLFNSYSDMFLGREVFLSEFPDRKVLVEFTSHRDKQVMADIFDAHVVMPLNQIEV